MQAYINIIKPDAIELHELRSGDNFEHSNHEGWIFKLVSGIKQYTPDSSDFNSSETKFAVVECSGEVMALKGTDKVYPLLETNAHFSYDFERKFEEDR